MFLQGKFVKLKLCFTQLVIHVEFWQEKIYLLREWGWGLVGLENKRQNVGKFLNMPSKD